MKRICIALATVAMLFATSCKNNNEPENIVLGENEFYATIANDANPQKAPAAGDEMSPKTTIDINNYVIWENTDQIYINGTEFTRSLSANKENVFATTGTVPTAPYYAFYAVTGASNSASATLPATQTYETGKVSNLPMYAYNQTSKELTFHNICAALKFNIPSSANGASKIEISTSDNKALNGSFTVNQVSENGITYYKAVMNVSGITSDNQKVTIQKSSGTFATNEIVYVAIPAATYDNLTFKFYDSSDQEITGLTKILSAPTEFKVNKVYNINYLRDGCFYIEAVNAGSTVSFSEYGDVSGFNGLEYSTDGTHFSDYTIGTQIYLDEEGDRVYFRAVANGNTTLALSDSRNYHYYFEVSGNVKAGGNVMYLLNQSGLNTFPDGSNNNFRRLFAEQSDLTDISNLSLPATELANHCYREMFLNCGSLTTAPTLPATTLATCCYYGMFCNCTSLTTAPTLPSTTLAASCYRLMFSGCESLTTAPTLLATSLANANCCYYEMFSGCTSLTTAPALPATTLADYCYQEMFSGCESLTTAPALPATTLAYCCYVEMFSGCTSLTTAPALPATTLADYCYAGMFNGCTSLTTAPELPATTLDECCYEEMFSGCTSLTTAPALPATTLNAQCYEHMFSGCSNLSSVTMLATDVTASYCLSSWLYDAGNSASGPTVYVNNSITSIASGAGSTIANNTPNIWSIKTQDGTHTLR